MHAITHTHTHTHTHKSAYTHLLSINSQQKVEGFKLIYLYFRCKKKTYPKRLPTVSVVVIFRNEAFTVLLRTATSIINRSPDHLLHEIILVDDFSDHGNALS